LGREAILGTMWHQETCQSTGDLGVKNQGRKMGYNMLQPDHRNITSIKDGGQLVMGFKCFNG